MDGISCKVPKDKEEILRKIVSDIEKKYSLEFEYQFFKKFIVRDVNNFIAISRNGYVKTKGWFVTDPNIEDSHNYLVVKKAVYEYFVNGADPYEYIKNHKDILDFCLSEKPSKKFKVYWGGEQVQRLNRYYVSKKGKRIWKVSDDTQRKTSLQDVASWAVELFNNYEEKNYYIDYPFYLQKCRNEIHKLENESLISSGNQLQLF